MTASSQMITVVIPFYNESLRLAPTVAEICAFCREHPSLIKEVIVVDDGSTDSGRTVESIVRFTAQMPLRIEQYSPNKGKWHAIRWGLNLATTDAVLIMDADGSASIWELDRLFDLQFVLRNQVAVFGSRFMVGSSVLGKTSLRTSVSCVYRVFVLFMYWFATGLRDVDDMQAPWKLIFKSKIQGSLTIDRFAGDVELACRLSCDKLNHPLFFVHHGGSKVRLTTSLRMALDTIIVCLTHKFKLSKATS